MPTIFVPKETLDGETRVSATPETVKRMVKDGFTVLVEKDAGKASTFLDEEYKGVGANIEKDAKGAYQKADIVLKLHAPTDSEAGQLRGGSTLVSFLWPLTNLHTVDRLAKGKITSFAMDQVPRITRAQKMDALSSQSNIGGYKAVLLGANHASKLFPMLMTAAGTIKPSKVVIMGAGVAGLQAIATAKRLGAIVEVSDIRPAVKEQVESLGGRFIEIETEEKLEDEGGYAKEVSAEFLKKQQEVLRKHIVGADVIITTALVPGKAAPRLVTADMVKDMRQGTVIVDMAAEQGGNCECTEPGKVIEHEGVTIIGTANLPGLLPYHASDVYAKNILAVVQHLWPKTEPKLDFEDEINDGSIVTHDGQIRMEAAAKALAEQGKVA